MQGKRRKRKKKNGKKEIKPNQCSILFTTNEKRWFHSILWIFSVLILQRLVVHVPSYPFLFSSSSCVFSFLFLPFFFGFWWAKDDVCQSCSNSRVSRFTFLFPLGRLITIYFVSKFNYRQNATGLTIDEIVLFFLANFLSMFSTRVFVHVVRDILSSMNTKILMQ